MNALLTIPAYKAVIGKYMLTKWVPLMFMLKSKGFTNYDIYRSIIYKLDKEIEKNQKDSRRVK